MSSYFIRNCFNLFLSALFCDLDSSLDGITKYSS